MPAPGEVSPACSVGHGRESTASGRGWTVPTPCPSYAAPQVAKNLEQAMALKEQGNQHFKEETIRAIAAYHQVRAEHRPRPGLHHAPQCMLLSAAIAHPAIVRVRPSRASRRLARLTSPPQPRARSSCTCTATRRAAGGDGGRHPRTVHHARLFRRDGPTVSSRAHLATWRCAT